MLYQLSYLFIIFIIYSMIGWIVEVINVYFYDRKFINRGFLMGPYCPIYGVGALFVILFLTKYMDDIVNFYILVVVSVSILEYFTSYVMEKVFNARWWDYSTKKFNLNGRISIYTSLAFGVLAIFVCYFLHPIIIDMLNLVPQNVLMIIFGIIIIPFIIDLSISLKFLTRLKKNIILLNKDMTEDINHQIAKFLEKNHLLKAFPLLNQKVVKIEQTSNKK